MPTSSPSWPPLLPSVSKPIGNRALPLIDWRHETFSCGASQTTQRSNCVRPPGEETPRMKPGAWKVTVKIWQRQSTGNLLFSLGFQGNGTANATLHPELHRSSRLQVRSKSLKCMPNSHANSVANEYKMASSRPFYQHICTYIQDFVRSSPTCASRRWFCMRTPAAMTAD